MGCEEKQLTYEDAVEILLVEKSWVFCPDCLNNRSLSCETCHGWYMVPNPKYAAACRVLGRPAPEKMTPRKVVQTVATHIGRMSASKPNLQNLQPSPWSRVAIDSYVHYSREDAEAALALYRKYYGNIWSQFQP